MFDFYQKISRFLTQILLLILMTSLIVITPTPKKVSAARAELQQGQFVTPFLYPPYPSAVKENSIFDHNAPDYGENQVILSYTGHTAADSCNKRVCNSATLGFTLSYDGHSGIDYDTNYLPILAAADSDQVLFAGWNHPTNHRLDLGLYVRLHHPNNYETYYGHLSAISVRTCSTVGCVNIPHGQMIGVSGNTSGSGGPHLHFEVRNPNGDPVDPYGWDPGHSLMEDKLRPDLASKTPIVSADSWADSWRSNPNDSLWQDLPEVAVPADTNTVLPTREGNPNSFPAGPVGGVIVDDNSHGDSPDFSTEGNSKECKPPG